MTRPSPSAKSRGRALLDGSRRRANVENASVHDGMEAVPMVTAPVVPCRWARATSGQGSASLTAARSAGLPHVHATRGNSHERKSATG